MIVILIIILETHVKKEGFVFFIFYKDMYMNVCNLMKLNIFLFWVLQILFLLCPMLEKSYILLFYI